MNPPYDEESEKAVLGSMMLDPDRVVDLCVEEGITEEHFYIPANRVIFSALVSMREHGRPIDILSVCQKLNDEKLMEQAGGVGHVEHIIDITITAAHAEYHIERLCKAFKRRCGSCIAMELQSTLVNFPEEDPEDIIAENINKLVDLGEDKQAKTNSAIAEESKSKWIAAKRGETSGIASPWRAFNERFGGLQKGVVTLFAGRAGKGKSSAAATWAHYLGCRNIPVAYMTFEDGEDRTWQRIAGIHGDFSVFKLDVGDASESDIERAYESMQAVMKMPIYLQGKHMNVSQISSWASRQKAKHGINVLFIDAFKDILRDTRDVASDDHHSQAICGIARRLDIPILVFHHVRKDGADAGSGELSGSDIRGSGQIYSDARQVILLQAIETPAGIEEYSFEIEKNNFGPTGRFAMERISNRCKWIEKVITTNSMGRAVAA